MPFPECFPKDFETDILPKLNCHKAIDVYRIIKSGIINREAFISTYEEVILGLIPQKNTIDEKDPGIYSTSCFMDKKEAKYFLSVFMRHHPKPIVSYGKTVITCGPSQITKERVSKKNTSHVDWWLYEKSSPQSYFREVPV